MIKEQLIELENGEKISAAHHTSDSDKWIFFCHGFGSNKEGSYERRANRAVKEGFNAVRFDFRGNGDSDGEFIDQSLSSRIKDLKKVIEFYKPEKYILFGSSFGGKVVLHYSEDNEPEAIIGRAPVTYNDIMSKYRSVVEEKGEFTHHEGATIDERFFEDFQEHQFDEISDSIDCPIAIFHGGSDSTVHFENSAEAIKELETDVHLHKFKGEKHSFSDEAEEKMLDNMFNWLKTIS